MADQCYSLVTAQFKQWTRVPAQLQLSFIWQGKENTPSRHEGGPTQKTQREEKPEAQFWLLSLYVFSPPPEPALCKLGKPGGLFVLPEVLTLVLGSSFVLFSRAFPFFVR